MNLSFCKGTDDHKLFEKVINQGIDAHLEGFTDSNFSDDGHRITCNFTEHEMQILLRRLDEFGIDNDEADSWVNDILYVYYGYEPYC